MKSGRKADGEGTLGAAAVAAGPGAGLALGAGAMGLLRDGTPARDHSTAPRRWDGSSTPGPVWSQHYLDLCRIFLLLRFSLRIRFLRHLALMAAHSRRA